MQCLKVILLSILTEIIQVKWGKNHTHLQDKMCSFNEFTKRFARFWNLRHHLLSEFALQTQNARHETKQAEHQAPVRAYIGWSACRES